MSCSTALKLDGGTLGRIRSKDWMLKLHKFNLKIGWIFIIGRVVLLGKKCICGSVLCFPLLEPLRLTFLCEMK